jgi:RNA polymerase sigma-70 factor (ECF subfamily)
VVPHDDIVLIVRAQVGDREALERLLRGIQPVVMRYVSRLAGADHAPDVVQEVLIAVARNIAWLTEPRLFRPWMFRIASRAAFRHLRKEKRWVQPDDQAVFEGIPAVEAPSDARLRELLDSGELSPASRAVLVLHFQEEMPLAEVAAALEIPLGTVKSRLAYGLEALRRQLGRSQ